MMRKLRDLLTLVLLVACSGLTVAKSEDSAQVTAGKAPEASADEETLSFRDVPILETAFFSSSPENRDDHIPVSELGKSGADEKMLLKLAKEIAEGQHARFDSLLIVHEGKLVFESYYLRGRVNLPHPQASATKGYLGMAIGRAIQLGYLTMADLDKPVIDFLEDLDRAKLADGVEKITLHQAMTMRSGLRLTEAQEEAMEANTEPLTGQKHAQWYLSQSAPVSGDSQSFEYQGADPTLVMQVLDAAVPGTASDFIRDELLSKLGTADYGWLEAVSGLPTAGYGSSVTSRAMVKWGLLVKNDGIWKGEQLIPEAFINRATNRIVHLGEDDIFFTGENVSKPGYGYFWWQADLHVGDQRFFSTSAQGGGGQYIILVEELDLMVVTTGHDRDIRPLRLTAEKILPAFLK